MHTIGETRQRRGRCRASRRVVTRGDPVGTAHAMQAAGRRRHRRSVRAARSSSGSRSATTSTHEMFGEGVIIDIEGSGDKAEAVVRFRDVGEKRLLLQWAPLKKI